MSMRFAIPDTNGMLSLENGDIVKMNYLELYKKTKGDLVFGLLEHSVDQNSFKLYNDQCNTVSICGSDLYRVISADEYTITLVLVLFDSEGKEIERTDSAPCITLCKKEAEVAFYPQLFADENKPVKEFKVIIRKIFEKEVCVDAMNEDEAIQIVRKNYADGEYLIDSENHKDTEIFLPNTEEDIN